MTHVSFDTTVKGGLPCTVEANIVLYRQGGELFSETESLDVFWPTRRDGKSRRMPLAIWKLDASELQTQAEERAING